MSVSSIEKQINVHHENILNVHHENILNAHNTIAIPVIKSGGTKKMILIVSLMKEEKGDKVFLSFILKKAKKYTGTIDKGALNNDVTAYLDDTDFNSDDSVSGNDADYYLLPWSDATNNIFAKDQKINTSLDITTDNGNIKLEIDNILVRKQDKKLKYYSSNSNPYRSATHKKKKLILTFSPSFDMFTNNIRSLSNHFSKIQEYQILQLIKYLYYQLNGLNDNGSSMDGATLKDISELGDIYNGYYPNIGNNDTKLSKPIMNSGDIQTKNNILNHGEIILTYGSKNIYFDFYSTIAHLYFYWLEYAYIHSIINGIVKSSNTKKNILKGVAFTILIAIAVTGVGLLVQAAVGGIIGGPVIFNVIVKLAEDKVEGTLGDMKGGNYNPNKNYEFIKRYNNKLNLIYKRKNLYKKRTFKRKSFKRKSFKRKSFKRKSFKSRSFKRRSFKKRSFKKIK